LIPIQKRSSESSTDRIWQLLILTLVGVGILRVWILANEVDYATQTLIRAASALEERAESRAQEYEAVMYLLQEMSGKLSPQRYDDRDDGILLTTYKPESGSGAENPVE
jgi:hypothetical protein